MIRRPAIRFVVAVLAVLLLAALAFVAFPGFRETTTELVAQLKGSELTGVQALVGLWDTLIIASILVFAGFLSMVQMVVHLQSGPSGTWKDIVQFGAVLFLATLFFLVSSALVDWLGPAA